MTAPLTVRTITPEEHLAFLQHGAEGRPRSASFLQTPAWGEVKSEWRSESLGWSRGEEIVGVGLALYRRLPRLRRYLAYLPEGPVIDWSAEHLSDWLAPMTQHLAERRAFAVRIGPPVVTRRWAAEVVKQGVADDGVRRLQDLPPTDRSPIGARVVSQLRELGWQQQAAEGGFAAGQPKYNFQIPLVTTQTSSGGAGPITVARTEDEVLRGMNQLWRRNIRKAEKAGVATARVGAEQLPGELKAFHDLYVHTAQRDRFTPRPLTYFATMFRALLAEDEDRIALYTARHDGDLVAATILIRVGGHVWYSYGASSTDKREVRGSNAVQWRMIRDAIATGAHVYDLRGITDTLEADDPHVGLIQFKVGTGGEAVEYAGEWDLPLNRGLYRAFSLYMARRG